MQHVTAFTHYVGLVVAVFAALLVAPRVTAASWRFVRRGFQREDTSPQDLPVAVREGVRAEPLKRRSHLPHFLGGDAEDEAEVLDTEKTHRRRVRRHAGEGTAGFLWSVLLEIVESRAVLLLLVGLLLRFFGSITAALPGAGVILGDLALVVVTFLVMRRVIYTYVPVERIAAELGPRVARAHAPFEQLLRLVLLSVAVVLLLTWPSQVGWQLASRGFGGDLHDTRVIVAWACELPWLMALTWLAVRHRLATAPASPTR